MRKPGTFCAAEKTPTAEEMVVQNKMRPVMLRVLLPLFNAMMLICLCYIIKYDIASHLFLKAIYFALFLSVLSIFAIRFSARVFEFLQNIQITFASLILLFVFFEFAAWLSPNFIPIQIRNYLATEDITEVRSKVVEYLNESPFVKFQPNTIVSSQGYRGSNQQFVYEWKTDKMGFKNLVALANKEQVYIVAVGDSFTEGAGVATEKTWASILTANGYSTYNLGVQGYAPTQLEGSLRKYGLKMKPKYIIIGYCAKTYGRENAFFNKEQAIQNKQFVGGIQSIVAAELRGDEIRNLAKYVVSAAYLWIRGMAINLIQSLKVSSFLAGGESISVLYRPYRGEILRVGSRTSMMKEIESGSKEWKSALSAFSNIITMAKDIDAKVLLLYLPHRGEIYYESATGKALPKRYFAKVEAHLLKQYADKNNISFLDLSRRFRSCVNALPNDTSASELPYLQIDGHMSNRGHEIVVKEIVDYLKSRPIR